MKEIWKEIHYGYSVSSLGRVKNKFNKIKNQTLNNGNGYLHTSINYKTKLVHRVIAIAFIPNPDNKQEVNHIDGNKQNNHISNLEWVTPKENKQHAITLGLMNNKGDKNGATKLNWDIVDEIRSLYNTGLYKQMQLCKKYNLASSTISRIVNYKNWNER
jgi:hypothetical protein